MAPGPGSQPSIPHIVHPGKERRGEKERMGEELFLGKEIAKPQWRGPMCFRGLPAPCRPELSPLSALLVPELEHLPSRKESGGKTDTKLRQMAETKEKEKEGHTDLLAAASSPLLQHTLREDFHALLQLLHNISHPAQRLSGKPPHPLSPLFLISYLASPLFPSHLASPIFPSP